MNEYFPKAKSFGAKVQVELDLLNYAKTKTDLRNEAGTDTSKITKKS